MRMIFNFKMSAEDYRQMQLCRTFGNSVFRRVILLLSWVVFTVLFICDAAHVLLLSRVVHLCALMVMTALPAALLTMEINIHKYKEAYEAGFQAQRQIIADEGGLAFCNKTTNESVGNPWEDVTKLEEMERVFVIQLNRRQAVILPKRGMGDEKRIEQFRELANRKIPARFYPLKRMKKQHEQKAGIC